MLIDDYDKAKILKDCLRIVDKLAESDLDDVGDKFTSNDFDYAELRELIKKAKKIKRSKYWKL